MTDTTRLPKWAQTLLADLTRERDEARALLPRREAVPDRMAIPVGRRYDDPLPGWDFNAYTGRVYPCWTCQSTHWRERKPSEHTSGIQGGRRLFATRCDALVALRIAKVEEFAKVLAEIDREIAKEGRDTP